MYHTYGDRTRPTEAIAAVLLLSGSVPLQKGTLFDFSPAWNVDLSAANGFGEVLRSEIANFVVFRSVKSVLYGSFFGHLRYVGLGT